LTSCIENSYCVRYRDDLPAPVCEEAGVTFAVVIVKRHVIDSSAEASRAIATFQPVFPGLLVVLMAQDHQGTPTYYGRQDIAGFSASVPLDAIPWKQYNV
jgi:hypothetical protein